MSADENGPAYLRVPSVETARTTIWYVLLGKRLPTVKSKVLALTDTSLEQLMT